MEDTIKTEGSKKIENKVAKVTSASAECCFIGYELHL